MKGTLVNRILSSAIKVAGSLAVIGGATAAAAAPAGAAPPPTSHAYGVQATGPITINAVARGHPAPHAGGIRRYQVPGFLTTGGILDRATGNAAYSDVGSPKVQLYQPVNQLNATDVMSQCRTILGALRFHHDPGRLDLESRPAVP